MAYNTNSTTAEYGNQNQAVTQLQTYLNSQGAGLSVDGKYGNLTQAAVARYGTGPNNNTITSANTAPVNTSVLPNSTPSTYGGMQGATESLINQNKSADEIARDEAKTKTDTSMTDYLKALSDSANISTSVDRSAQDAAKRESDRYTSQLEQEQLANRRAVEELQRNNPGGTFGGALSNMITETNRASLSKQADIAILQTAANRNYDTAAQIADRQVALKLEKSTANLAALKFFYENNKADFDKKDDRLYEEVLKKKERELKKQTDTENSIKDLKLNVAQFAGSSAAGLLAKLSAIDTTKPGAFDQAVKIAGKYASDPLDRQLKQAQINKLNKESKAVTEAPTIKSINGVDLQWNGSSWVTPTGAGGSGSTADQTQAIKDKIAGIDALVKNKPGFVSAVGPSAFARNKIDFTGHKQDFIASVQQIVSQDTLKTLIDLKKAGGTLGALSDQERIMLQSAATKIGSWAITDKNGRVTGYNASEASFAKELGTIRTLSQRALDASGATLDSYLDNVDSVLQDTTSIYMNAGYLRN